MKLTALALVLDVLAAYRLTRLVVEDSFPPVKALRDRIVARHTRVTATATGTLVEPDAWAELAQCPWCAGAWICAVVTAAQWLAPGVWAPVSWALALSAAVGVVSQLVDE